MPGQRRAFPHLRPACIPPCTAAPRRPKAACAVWHFPVHPAPFLLGSSRRPPYVLPPPVPSWQGPGSAGMACGTMPHISRQQCSSVHRARASAVPLLNGSAGGSGDTRFSAWPQRKPPVWQHVFRPKKRPGIPAFFFTARDGAPYSAALGAGPEARIFWLT